MELHSEMSIADYDHDIANLEQTLLDLKRKRNTLTRTHTIPVEILTKVMVQVFTFTALASVNEYTHDGEEWEGNCDRVDWSWRSMMLVCQRFRDVALACPQLWSIVDMRHVTRWTRLCQSRMSGYPDSTLLGSVQGDVEADAETVALLRTCHHAQINSRITQDSKYLPLDQMLPSLRSLYLGGHARGAGDFIMTSRFLGGYATALTHLVLDYGDSLSIDDAPAFPALRYLNLRHFVTDMQGNALRLLLAKTPQLRSLVLRYLQRKRTNDVTQVEHRRPEGQHPLLPHLTYLRWTGPLVPTLMATVIPEVLEDSFQLVVSHVAPDDTLFAFVCGLISQHDHRRLNMSPSRAWSLTEVSQDPEGSKVILESIAETPAPGPKITIPSSWENAFVLLDQVDTLHLESSFALCMYKDKIVHSANVQHLSISLSEDTSRWRMSCPQLLRTIEEMCASRAGLGSTFDTISVSFDPHRRKEAAEMGLDLEGVRHSWIEKGWFNSISFA